MYIALARNLVDHVGGTWHVQAPAYTLLIEPGQELAWRQEMPEVLKDSLVDKLLLEMKVPHRRRKQPDKQDIRLAQALADQSAQEELLRSKQEQARQV